MVQAAANQMQTPLIQKSNANNISNPSSESNSILLSAELNEPPLDKSDFQELNVAFAALFGNVYYNKDSTEFARLQLLWAILQEKGYSKGDVKQMMLKFGAGKAFATWKPNEFIDAWEPPKLLSYSEYLALPQLERKWFVDYETSRGKRWGDSRIIGKRLKRCATGNEPTLSQTVVAAAEIEAARTNRTATDARWFRQSMREANEAAKLRGMLDQSRADRDIAEQLANGYRNLVVDIGAAFFERMPVTFLRIKNELEETKKEVATVKEICIALFNSLPSETLPQSDNDSSKD
jgi:hypothetical protein